MPALLQVQSVAEHLRISGPKSSMNLAEIQLVMSRLSDDTEEFMRSVYIHLRRAPAIIFYIQEPTADR